MKGTLSIDSARLWESLSALGQIGAFFDAGLGLHGVNRLALSAADAEGRRYVANKMHDLGLSVTTDRIGNVYGKRPGLNHALSPVLLGSHIDSVATAGRFDGCLGVLGALEIIKTLNDANRATQRPVIVAFFTDEEGARFGTDMLGSAVATARIPLHQAYALTDREGRSVQDELRAIGFLGNTDPILSPPYAYLECHIEQGPVLRKSGMDIGVVQGVQAISWQKLTLIGRSAHAGTTPMELRADASVVASRINLHMRDMTRSGRFGTELRATMGGMFPQPGLVNVIPGHMVVTVDLRHPDNQTLHAAEQELRTFCEHAAQQEGVSVSFLQTAKTDSVVFDEGLKQRIEQAASRRNLSFQRIISGAGHDAQELARLTRAAMVFVPGEFDGISHNPREYSTEKQCADGVNVLLDVLLSLADET